MEDVRIRLEVEGMRHQVVHAFAGHQGVIREIVEDRLSRVLDDWRIDNEVDDAIRVELGNVVQTIISSEVKALLDSSEVRGALQVAIAESLTGALRARGLLPKEGE